MTSQDLHPDAGRRLSQRYGAPAPWRRRVVLVVSVLLGVLFVGWLSWTIFEQATPAVESQLETYSIGGEHEATGVVVVRLSSPDVQATCLLRAYAEDHSIVGEKPFTPDPATARQVEDIRTERTATSVESVGCTAPGQTQPR